MVDIRPFTVADIPALQTAIDKDTFHPGEWSVRHFYDDPADKDALNIPKEVSVISDQHGPIAFVRYTKSLRISCVWNDATDVHRNGRAIVNGILDAVKRARASGFTELIITTESDKLADFFKKILKMENTGKEFLLQV